MPPRCLFPEEKDLPSGFNFRKNLITVPSCDVHNSEKSKDDEYLMWILSTTFQGNDFKTRNFVSKGMRAFNRQPDSFLNFMENLTQLNIKQPDDSLYESASFQVDLKRFDNCIKQIAVGLYFHHTKSKWVGNYGVITNAFVELTGSNVEKVNQTIFDASKSVRESFAGYPAYGDNPEIFTYKYAFDQQNSHVIHMIFYEGVDISVLLGD